MSNKNLLAALAVTLLSVPACAVDQTPMNDDGLTALESAKDKVSGSYEQDGVAIDFTFERRGSWSHLRVEAAEADLVLVDTVFDGTLETTVVFNAHRFTGEVGRVSTFDTDVLAELAAMPEMQLMPELRAALDDAGIDPTLLDGATSTDSTLGTILCPTVTISTTRIGAAATELSDRN